MGVLKKSFDLPPNPQGGFLSISKSPSPPLRLRVAASAKQGGGFRGKNKGDFSIPPDNKPTQLKS